jgi:hypothetical protein
MQTSQSIIYFDREGRENLSQVLRVVKRVFKKRPEVRSHPLLVFTAIGEGAALAYNLLQEYDPKIIAITFSPDFYVMREGKKVFPQIPDKIKALFDGIGIKVIKSRLPFDEIEGMAAHNEQMKLLKSALTLFGGGFVQCVQAVLQACDHDVVPVGEKVISITGDSAAIITASTTKGFLTRESGLVINEILCKANNFTIARAQATKEEVQSPRLFDSEDVKQTNKKGLSAQTGRLLEAKD